MSIYNLFCNIPLIIIAILGIGFLIAFHELGHFLFCKLFKVKTPSFSIGFGPRIFQKKIGDTTFALSLIPLGGYVEIAGAHEIGQGEQKEAFSQSKYSFAKKPYYQKMLIISGGILFNLIFAWFALSSLLFLGAPCIGQWCTNKQPIILNTENKSSAQKAGLEKNDKIISINNQRISSIKQVSDIAQKNINKTIDLTVLRNNQEKHINLTIGSKKIKDKEISSTGITWYIPPISLYKAITEGFKSTLEITKSIFMALGNLFHNRSMSGIGGPLMLISQVTKSVGMGAKVFIFILALISINLAVFNVLPFPIFDGGQALLYTIEAIKGKPISLKTKERIQYYTWLSVIILVIFLTYKDILKLFGC